MTAGTTATSAASGTAGTARVWNIATGRPFLDTLASAVLDGSLPHADGTPPDQFALATITILLPTNRAVRAMQEAFLRAARGRALLLPRLVPIAVADEEDGLLSDLAAGSTPLGDAFALAPAIGKLERQLTLTHLVLEWSRRTRARTGDDAQPFAPAGDTAASTPAQAAHLAADLASLMDMVETEGQSLDGIASLVPDDFSAHWQQTIDFLAILTKYWPAHLVERARLSPADRRNRLIAAETERLRRAPPGPVIVAGVPARCRRRSS